MEKNGIDYLEQLTDKKPHPGRNHKKTPPMTQISLIKNETVNHVPCPPSPVPHGLNVREITRTDPQARSLLAVIPPFEDLLKDSRLIGGSTREGNLQILLPPY